MLRLLLVRRLIQSEEDLLSRHISLLLLSHHRHTLLLLSSSLFLTQTATLSESSFFGRELSPNRTAKTLFVKFCNLFAVPSGHIKIRRETRGGVEEKKISVVTQQHQQISSDPRWHCSFAIPQQIALDNVNSSPRLLLPPRYCTTYSLLNKKN